MTEELEDIKTFILDEGKSWKSIQDIRGEFNPKLKESIRANSRKEALERATDVVYQTLESMGKIGIDFQSVCPGHGIGHLTRDYTASLALLKRLDADPRDLFVGFVGGSLHDIGCTLVERYQEHNRVVRHAEAGALTFLSLSDNLELNNAEKTSIAHSIAAHTHYRRDEEVSCSDGVARTIQPYQELDESGKPILSVWIPRWIDRLDCNGPAFPARHYLTLAEEHKDFDGEAHFDVKFEAHMRPLARPMDKQVDAEGRRDQTMSEHMIMFGNSQSKESPYGKHDYGTMIRMRDSAKAKLFRITDAVTEMTGDYSSSQERNIRDRFTDFLGRNIEPTELGIKTATTLDKMFGQLPEESRQAWLKGFNTLMSGYNCWADERLNQIEGFSEKTYKLPTIAGDVKHIIKPYRD